MLSIPSARKSEPSHLLYLLFFVIQRFRACLIRDKDFAESLRVSWWKLHSYFEDDWDPAANVSACTYRCHKEKYNVVLMTGIFYLAEILSPQPGICVRSTFRLKMQAEE